MEATTGLEPVIAALQAAALPLGYVASIDGAEDGIRTRDLLHGKQMLYH